MTIFTTLLLNERLKERGISTSDEYINSRTKMKFRCLYGHEWITTPVNVRKCRDCSNKRKTSSITKVVERLASKNIKLIGDYVNNKTVTTLSCMCGHKWQASVHRTLYGIGCPECTPKSKNSLLTTSEINKRLLGRGIEIVDEYIGSGVKSKFKCSIGHIWNAVPNNVLHNSSCPQCSKHGFKPHLSAHFYIFKRHDYIKYGITNDLKKRIKQHEVHGDLEVVFTRYYDLGSEALVIEKLIKDRFGGSFAKKEQCPNGHTETLCETKLQELLKSIL